MSSSSGYEKLREISRAWRDAVGQAASTGAKILPEGMERDFEEAFRQAFTVRVARVFAVAALVALACAVLAWFGLRGTGARHETLATAGAKSDHSSGGRP